MQSLVWHTQQHSSSSLFNGIEPVISSLLQCHILQPELSCLHHYTERLCQVLRNRYTQITSAFQQLE